MHLTCFLQDGITHRSHSEGEFIDPPAGTVLNQPPYLPAGVAPPPSPGAVPRGMRSQKSVGEITFNGHVLPDPAAAAAGFGYSPTVPKRKKGGGVKRKGKKSTNYDLVSPGL